MTDTPLPAESPYVNLVTGPPPDVPTLTWEDMIAAYEKLRTDWVGRDRFIMPEGLYARAYNAASPEFRKEMESLRASGTLITSSLLPRNDCVWRISGVDVS